MSFYRGIRNSHVVREPRDRGDSGARRGRGGEKGEKTFFFKMFEAKEKEAPVREQKAYGYYRPGVTRLEGMESSGGAVRPQAAPTSLVKGMKWGLRLAGLFLLAVVLVWSRGRTTALLQDAAGLKLSKVSVEGNHYLTEDEIIKAVALAPGENMFKLDLKEANERVNKLDWAERVFIERRLPSSILISVRERKPVALLDNGSLYGVDRDGRVLSSTPVLVQEDLPLISGAGFRADAVGTTLMAEALRPALDLFAFLDKEDRVLAQNVSEVNLSEKGALRVTFIDGIQATFEPPVSEAELRRMALVLSDLNGKGKRAGTMDFRYRDMVLVKTR